MGLYSWLRHRLRTFRPFGLTVIVTRPTVNHVCGLTAHAQEYIGYFKGGKGCRLCLQPDQPGKAGVERNLNALDQPLRRMWQRD